MARYYRKYRTGGRSVPGMYKAQNGNGEDAAQQQTTNKMKGDNRPVGPIPPNMQSMNQRPMVQDSAVALATQNAMIDMQMKEAAIRQQELARVMQQMQMQNMLLQQQNELQKTQIQKMDLINSARTTNKQVGATNSPKRRGGTIKAKRGKRVEILSSGNMMRHGGGMGRKGKCLPGGRFSKRR